jgi:glucose/arabinose dehydrogenase
MAWNRLVVVIVCLGAIHAPTPNGLNEGMLRMPTDIDSKLRPRLLVTHLLLALITLSTVIVTSPSRAQTQKPAAQPKASGNNATQLLPALATRVAFPNIRFDRPVALAYPDDGGNLLFVVEQHRAAIWSFPNQRQTVDRKLFLKLSAPIHTGNEEGLLGLAFHPKYKDNKQFFVYYSANDGGQRRSVVSRFQASSDNPRKADPASEERIWVSEEDPFENHNGGTIAFGPDGYLYITLGDSGAADDPKSTGQNPTDWFASILRIDIDHPSPGQLYGIPADNPARRSQRYAHWAPEVYCIGLRNVWKFSFDRQTGELWAGDVGQNLWEMVHLIENGGNYGWSIREGFHLFQPQRRQRPDPAAKIQPPIVEYPHAPTRDRQDSGLSITGGYVYRGKKIPQLVGVYVYADFETGRIWGLRYQDERLLANGELINIRQDPGLKIASFGEDSQGELYFLSFHDGRIHELVPRARTSKARR